MKTTHQITVLTLAATVASLSTGCLSVTGFDSPSPPRSAEDTLFISVDARPAEGQDGPLVRNVAASASQNLARRGFRLVDGNSSDVQVSFTVSQKEYNRAGDFIVYDGRVDGRVSMGGGSRIVDETVLSARGNRALGETAATDALSSALLPQVDAWVGKTVTAEKLGVAVVTVSVEYRRIRESSKVGLVRDFINATESTDGVRACQLVGESWVPRWWRADYTAFYRIVYDTGAFPNGPLNTISLHNPGLNLSVLPAAAPAPAMR